MKLIATAAALTLLAGCGGGGGRSSYGGAPSATTTTMEPSATSKSGGVTVELREQNGSGESGTATISGLPKKAEIVVELNGAPATPQPAHIHVGSCDALGTPYYKITDVVDGKSNTVLGRIDELQGEDDFAINVHKSYDDIDTYVACGVIPKKAR